MPEISVIVPIYNVEKYLEKCIESILNQTFADFELILVNDGSPDGSAKICEKYAKTNDKIKLISQENAGLSAARNAGINIAKGKYLAFIDGDDYITDDMLEILHSNAKKTNSQISACGMVDTYGDEFEIKHKINNYEIFDSYNALKTILEGKKMYMFACNKLFEASLFNDVKFPPGKLYEDVFIMPILMAKAKRVVYTPKQCYIYFQRINSITNSSFKLRDLTVIEGCESHKKMIESNYPGLKKQIEFRILYSHCMILDKIVMSEDYYFSELYKNMRGIVKKNIFKILVNPHFTLKRKLIACLSVINKTLYKKVIKIF